MLTKMLFADLCQAVFSEQFAVTRRFLLGNENKDQQTFADYSSTQILSLLAKLQWHNPYKQTCVPFPART